jgi:kynureninase
VRIDRAAAAERDAADPLGPFRDRFVVADPDLIYLDGNSLGRLSHDAVAAVEEALHREWGAGLVRSWDDWIDLPARTGDLLAPLVGAAPGEVLVADQTSVNLYKLAAAAVSASAGRADIITDSTNFPSDRYVLAGVAEAAGGRLREVAADPIEGPRPGDIAAALDGDVGLVSLSHVAFRSGAVADMAAITAMAHEAGAFALWDLSHSAGAVEVDLGGAAADLAVGCTYKHLNGGPGAPGFLYVAGRHHGRLHQPIRGWFGHADMFAFEDRYRPAAGIAGFAVGTPPILALRAAEAAISVTAAAGMAAVAAKNRSLTSLLVDLFDERLTRFGFALGSPREPRRRGAQVALGHREAWRITRALIERAGVVPDFRAPDSIRLGMSALTTTHVEVWDAVDRLVRVMEARAYAEFPQGRGRVT